MLLYYPSRQSPSLILRLSHSRLLQEHCSSHFWFDGSSGPHDNYGSALTAQPGGSQGRPATNTSSRLNVRIGLPTDVFPVPPSRMVTPYARTKAIQARRAGTVILIPVTNPIESTFATVPLERSDQGVASQTRPRSP